MKDRSVQQVHDFLSKLDVQQVRIHIHTQICKLLFCSLRHFRAYCTIFMEIIKSICIVHIKEH